MRIKLVFSFSLKYSQSKSQSISQSNSIKALKKLMLFLILPFLGMMTSCETMDKLRYAYEGKDLNQIQIFGTEDLDLNDLDKINLKGFSIADFHHPLVKKHIKLYQLYGKKNIEAIINRASHYLPMIKKIFKEKGIPEDLAYLPFIESGFNPRATSHAGASGLWQFMFLTGKAYKLNANYWIDDRRDIYRSTIAAAYHLRYLYKRFDDWLLVLAAYNAGGGKISRAIKMYNSSNYWKLIEGSYLKPETKNYVAKFIAASIMTQNPEKYGLSFTPAIPPKLRQIKVEDATDIRLLASSADMDLSLFKRYNPQIKQWATPPSRSYPIYILEENYQKFITKFNKIPKEERVTYRRYFVRIGDNLTTIAKKFDIPINPIAKINKFHSLNDIHAGNKIIIPIQGLNKARNLDQQLVKKVITDQGKYTFLYLVQPRDSLYQVANKFKVSLSDLMRWNNLKSVKSLRGGKLIIIKI